MVYTLERVKEKLAQITNDTSLRTFEVTVYYETVDKSSNVHATTRVFRYEKDYQEA